jgi:hypothetical protein
LVSYDDTGKITNFGSVEVQAVYISGNVRAPFEYYLQDPATRYNMDWTGKSHYPRPDYLSSSRKRLAPQLLFKGGILRAWNKKQAVVIHRSFFNTLPELTRVPSDEADLAWLIYDLNHDARLKLYKLSKSETIYTKFEPSMLKITTTEPGSVDYFIGYLQSKLDEKLDNNPPDAPTLSDDLLT